MIIRTASYRPLTGVLSSLVTPGVVAVAARCRVPVQIRCEAATAATPAVIAEDKWLARNVMPLVSASTNRYGSSSTPCSVVCCSVLSSHAPHLNSHAVCSISSTGLLYVEGMRQHHSFQHHSKGCRSNTYVVLH
jgi:hypothetical protein